MLFKTIHIKKYDNHNFDGNYIKTMIQNKKVNNYSNEDTYQYDTVSIFNNNEKTLY